MLKNNKVPWILKWQYVKDGDVLKRCWYTKWWAKFHAHKVINNVFRNIPSCTATTLPAVEISTPVQTATTTSSSDKTIEAPVKPKKEMASFLDNIKKDPDAMYSLLQMMAREKLSTDGQCSNIPVPKSPYYPYNQEWFGHDEDDEDPDLAED